VKPELNKKFIFFCVTIFFYHFSAFGEEKLQEEKELEVVNFSSVKQLLKKDGLDIHVEKKKNDIKVLKKTQEKINLQRFQYPSEDELWNLVTEYWLIKNAQILAWDFEKADFALEKSFSHLLEEVGFYQKRFKILLLNSSTIVRAGLPGNQESILLLSLPFIRALDLSKIEISLLLFEDYIRLEQSYFKKNVTTDKMLKLAGSNFAPSKPDSTLVNELLLKYNSQVFENGFTFSQQFEVTKKMDAFLRSRPELWNAYTRLLNKMDKFLKTNLQYKDYVRMYPSPEMQLKWLGPEEKVL
jgi:hypothetical protein